MGTFVVTIDGPAGAGKSTAARGLAGRLGFEFLDTGAMYRAVALAAVRAGLSPTDPDAVADFLAGVTVDMPGGQVVLNGRDVSGEIRTAEVAQAASVVAVVPAVRHLLVRRQREVAAGRRMVSEGRDQGTVVFPDARCKFFLTADPAERARRRLADLLARGHQTSFDVVLADQEERDRRDACRDLSPMRPADDAVVIDTSGVGTAELLDRLEREVRRCLSDPTHSSTTSRTGSSN